MRTSIKMAKQMIEDAVKAYLAKDEKGNYKMPEIGKMPLYMEGPPGIGKTEIARQVADKLGIGFKSFSLTHHTRNSLMGLPVIRDLPNGGKYTEYTMSEIIAAVVKCCEKGQKEGILLLDETNCVSETLRPILLSFLQTKNIGEYTLPEGWVILMAGNPRAYNRSARPLDMAILDRVRKIEVEFDDQVFLDYAEEMHFHPAIIDYLSANPSYAYVLDKEDGKEETVTARGWENLSRTLIIYDELGIAVEPEFVRQFIKSDAVVFSFMDHYTLMNAGCTTQEIEEVLAGLDTSEFEEQVDGLSDRVGILLADYLVRRIAGHARSKMSKQRVDQEVTNTFRFLENLESRIPLERFFSVLNKDAEIVSVMVKQKNAEYQRMCRTFLAA